MAKSTKPQKAATQKHHAAVYRVLKDVLALETSKTTKGDARLAKEIQKRGVFASQVIVEKVRKAHKIGTAYERQMALFAKESK